MNRFLLGGCLMVLFGCGARTESLFDDVAYPDDPSGLAGNSAGGALQIAGAPGFGAAPSVAGAASFGAAANSPGIGGGASVGGAASFGGAVSIAGSPSFGGAVSVGGATSSGGAVSIAGSPSFGGAVSVGGASVGGASVGGATGVGATGATSGVIEACQLLSGNACQLCQCTTCSSQILQCFSNLGCGLVLACAQQTGCQGLACYRPGTCKAVIDQFGGLGGQALQDVLSLLTCSVSSQNACGCN